MSSVLLVTFNLMPDGEPGAAALSDAFAERDIDARWVCWDDPTVDWAAADLVAVRSTWDYHRRLPAFLDWARAVEAQAPVLNGADVFAWNIDKAYLVELADALPVVPTVLLDDATLVSGLTAAFERWGTVVVKPASERAAGAWSSSVGSTTGASSTWLPVPGSCNPWSSRSAPVVRPRSTSSTVARPRRSTSRWRRRRRGGAGARGVRRQQPAVPARPGRADVAEHAVRAVATRLDADLAYARVDLMEWDGAWVVREIELIEPGLYLDVAPRSPARSPTWWWTGSPNAANPPTARAGCALMGCDHRRGVVPPLGGRTPAGVAAHGAPPHR